VARFSQALHGFCCSCYFATAYIYTERIAEKDIRNSAQTVFGMVILGIGPVLAGPLSSALATYFGNGETVTNFSGMRFTLAGMALVTTVLFGALFRDETAGLD
jgi:MFS family permease